MQESAEDLICITATPGKRKISATYVGRKNALRLYNNRDQYKLFVYRALEDMFSSGTKKDKKIFCSVSSGDETQEFRGKLNLTGRGWEIAGDGSFEHSSFDVFGALVSEDTDSVYIEVYRH